MPSRFNTLVNYGMIAVFGLILVQRVMGGKLALPFFGKRRDAAEDFLPPGLLGELRELLDQGRTFEAIAAYRSATGKGISEAMDAIDRLRRGDYD